MGVAGCKRDLDRDTHLNPSCGRWCDAPAEVERGARHKILERICSAYVSQSKTEKSGAGEPKVFSPLAAQQGGGARQSLVQ